MSTNRTFIVAEIGVNHNGSVDLAKQLVDSADSSGADAVKFQSFQVESLVSVTAPKAEYQKDSTDDSESQYDMLRNLQLSQDDYRQLRAYCNERGIGFLSTPFDVESMRFLVHDLHLSVLKVASGEVTNLPLLVDIARANVRVILSTGMCTLAETERALAALAFGFTQREMSQPSVDKIHYTYVSDEGQAALADKVTLLHTTSEYPAPFENVNLRAMTSLADAFGLPVGLSDHTPGIAVAVAAVARGATIVEKHLTLDRNMRGPDHAASLEPYEFRQLVESIRQVEEALGSPVKKPTLAELEMVRVARRSLVAAKDIASGEVFSEENLTLKRPGTGVSAVYYWDFIGKVAQRPYRKDEKIEWT